MLKYLAGPSRRKLIQSLVSFIDMEYNGNRAQQHIITVCHAAIKLFTSLKTDRSLIGGIVSAFVFDEANLFWILFSLEYEIF